MRNGVAMCWNKTRIHLSPMIIALLASAPALSDEADAHAGHGEDVEHRNTFGIFVGATSEDRSEGLTLGLEYERRFGSWFGIDVAAERVFGDFDVTVVTATFAYHEGRWKAYVGPGVENIEGESDNFVRIGSEHAFQ